MHSCDAEEATWRAYEISYPVATHYRPRILRWPWSIPCLPCGSSCRCEPPPRRRPPSSVCVSGLHTATSAPTVGRGLTPCHPAALYGSSGCYAAVLHPFSLSLYLIRRHLLFGLPRPDGCMMHAVARSVPAALYWCRTRVLFFSFFQKTRFARFSYSHYYPSSSRFKSPAH